MNNTKIMTPLKFTLGFNIGLIGGRSIEANGKNLALRIIRNFFGKESYGTL